MRVYHQGRFCKTPKYVKKYFKLPQEHVQNRVCIILSHIKVTADEYLCDNPYMMYKYGDE